MGEIRQIQEEVSEWQEKNFGETPLWQPVMGLCEEAGEAAHACLKLSQGIRGTAKEHSAALYDAVGDCTIFLMDICNHMGWDFERVAQEVWRMVQKRNWRADPKNGSVSE